MISLWKTPVLVIAFFIVVVTHNIAKKPVVIEKQVPNIKQTYHPVHWVTKNKEFTK